MSNVYMRTHLGVEKFIPGNGLPNITATGVTVDSTQVPAILAAAASAKVSIEQRTDAPYPVTGQGWPRYSANSQGLWPWAR